MKNSIKIFNVLVKINYTVRKNRFSEIMNRNGQLEVFETFHNFLSENDLCMSQEIRKIIVEHLKKG